MIFYKFQKDMVKGHTFLKGYELLRLAAFLRYPTQHFFVSHLLEKGGGKSILFGVSNHGKVNVW